MTRLLFWIALIILVVWAVRSKVRAMMAPPAQGMGQGMGPDPRQGGGDARYRRVPDETESMACCAECGLYFPASESVRVDGRDYCSPAHARQPSLRKPG